jgi:short subunit dehydrogenase-like uncharacterized protein
MAQPIVVFGATGYTGGLVAERLVAAGARPVLAGRDLRRLDALAARLGVEHVVADADRPGTIRALLEPRSVLVSTVGPFSARGHGVIGAAIDRRATYLDSTGEPSFIRAVFERHGPLASRAGVTLLPAMGFDYVPGALAGGLALAQAGASARRVEIGYFVLGAAPGGSTSRGTRRSAASALLEPSFAYRQGALRTVRLADRARRLRVAGRSRAAVTVGGAEHFGLPAVHPHLSDVEVYAGFFGAAVPLVRGASALAAGASRLPGLARRLRPVLEARAGRGGSPATPAHRGAPGSDAPGRGETESVVVARAYGDDGDGLASVELRGPEPYALTAGILAWAARTCASGTVAEAGAVGPVGAFGLAALEAGCATAGLRRVA